MVSLEELARIAEIEFSDIVDSTERVGTQLRIMLIQESFIDVWLSRKLKGKFGFHWEQKDTGLFYRYDNFPNTKCQAACILLLQESIAVSRRTGQTCLQPAVILPL